MTLLVGTPYFPTLSHAVAYYEPYGFDESDVRGKIEQGEIHLGTPPKMVGEVRRRIRRYQWIIETIDPKGEV